MIRLGKALGEISKAHREKKPREGFVLVDVIFDFACQYAFALLIQLAFGPLTRISFYGTFCFVLLFTAWSELNRLHKRKRSFIAGD